MTWAPSVRIVIALGVAVIAGAAGGCGHPVSPAAVTGANVCRRAAPACVGVPPTYERDVEPILRQRCFGCHAGNGAAADEHDFAVFETLHAQRTAVTNEIAACAMPPSGPPVPDAEADVLLRWVACGGLQ